jgi:hypothetical protein
MLLAYPFRGDFPKAAGRERAPKNPSRPASLPSGQPFSLSAGMQRLKDAQIPVELVPRRTVSNRSSRRDPQRTRADAIDDALRVAEEVDQVLDQIGIIEMSRCRLPQCAPELPQRVAISLSSDSTASFKSAFPSRRGGRTDSRQSKGDLCRPKSPAHRIGQCPSSRPRNPERCPSKSLAQHPSRPRCLRSQTAVLQIPRSHKRHALVDSRQWVVP